MVPASRPTLALRLRQRCRGGCTRASSGRRARSPFPPRQTGPHAQCRRCGCGVMKMIPAWFASSARTLFSVSVSCVRSSGPILPPVALVSRRWRNSAKRALSGCSIGCGALSAPRTPAKARARITLRQLHVLHALVGARVTALLVRRPKLEIDQKLGYRHLLRLAVLGRVYVNVKPEITTALPGIALDNSSLGSSHVAPDDDRYIMCYPPADARPRASP